MEKTAAAICQRQKAQRNVDVDNMLIIVSLLRMLLFVFCEGKANPAELIHISSQEYVTSRRSSEKMFCLRPVPSRMFAKFSDLVERHSVGVKVSRCHVAKRQKSKNYLSLPVFARLLSYHKKSGTIVSSLAVVQHACNHVV